MEEKNEEGLSIGDFFRLVWSQKILALIVVVAVTLVGTIGLYFGYNAITADYTVAFRMSLPDAENFLTDYTYPDGTVFYYTSLVSAGTLEAVKATDERFEDIDESAIEISYNYSTSADTESYFTLTAKTSAFKNEEVARDFLVELANYPVRYFSTINYDYHSTLASYLAAKGDKLTNYDALLTMLEDQLATIQSAYADLKYSDSFSLTAADGTTTTLGAYKNEVESYANSGIINVMRLNVRGQALVKSQDVKDNMALQIVGLREELAAAEDTLAALTSSNIIQDGTVIVAQSKKVNSLKLQVADMENYIANGNVDPAFISSVEEVYTRLNQLTSDLEQVTKQVNEKVATVIFTSSTIIDIEHMGAAVATAISLLIGIIAAVISAYCVAVSKSNKLSAQTVEQTPAKE